MRRSDALLCTRRDADGHTNETVARTMRAGLVRQFGSGLYGFTPVGQRVRTSLIELVAREMDAIGGQRISLPALNDDEIWKRSGRWKDFEGELFTLDNRDGRRLCLAPSHEEGVVHLVDGVVRSYDDLPLLLYQIESKYRDDHARTGLVRTKEFTMKDAYSLHTTRDSLEATYERVREAYVRLFEALDIDFSVAVVDDEVMGGTASEEFVALAGSGGGTVELRRCTADECRFAVTDESPCEPSADDPCPRCGGRLAADEGIEIAHIFELGTRYTDPMGLTVDGPDGADRDVLMGSYGIGVERLLHVLVDQHADEDGCRWPEIEDAGVGIAPFSAAIVPLDYSGELRAVADRLYESCGTDETLLFDDPAQTIGERFAESDLLGVPWKVVLGNHYRETGEVELETRDGTTEYGRVEDVANRIG